MTSLYDERMGTSGRWVRVDDWRPPFQGVWEASPHDRIWGIGMGAADPRADDPAQWDGENLLGFALMTVRNEL